MNSGTHRLVSLKCGHLFGKKCVEQWLKSQSTCPTCKVRVRKTDIRIIFCDRIAVVDNQTIEELKAKLEKEKVRNQQLQAALSQRTSSQSHSPPRRCTSPSPVHTTNSSDLISKYVVLLSCPYQEREEAKALGARFDGQLKKWYVPPGLNVRLFSKWLPQPMSSS
jgi:E3 ubiquitin-protein ligase RFWD3